MSDPAPNIDPARYASSSSVKLNSSWRSRMDVAKHGGHSFLACHNLSMVSRARKRCGLTDQTCFHTLQLASVQRELLAVETAQFRREERDVLEDRIRVDEVCPRAHCVPEALQADVDLLHLRV